MSEYCRRLFIIIDIDPERGNSSSTSLETVRVDVSWWELLCFVVGDEKYFGFKIIAISMDYPPLNPWFKWCPTCA